MSWFCRQIVFRSFRFRFPILLQVGTLSVGFLCNSQFPLFLWTVSVMNLCIGDRQYFAVSNQNDVNESFVVKFACQLTLVTPNFNWFIYTRYWSMVSFSWVDPDCSTLRLAANKAMVSLKKNSRRFQSDGLVACRSLATQHSFRSPTQYFMRLVSFE